MSSAGGVETRSRLLGALIVLVEKVELAVLELVILLVVALVELPDLLDFGVLQLTYFVLFTPVYVAGAEAASVTISVVVEVGVTTGLDLGLKKPNSIEAGPSLLVATTLAE